MASQEKLERFVAEFSERGYHFAYGLCGSAEDAKELVQEAFVRVFRNWESYDESQGLESWYLTILRNVFLDSVKRYERRRGVSLDTPLSPGREEGASLAEHIADPREDGVLDRLCRESMVAEVGQAFAGLKVEQKAILTLCDVEGLSYERIARVLDCPVGTVRSRVSRARAALKQAVLETDREVDAHGL